MENHIIIFGDIGEGFFGDGNTLETVKAQIDNNASELIVHINSIGGNVIEGFAIYDFLRRVSNEKKVTTIIEGAAYSMGSIIALAGDERLMQENSDYMIHAPMSMAIGTAADVKAQSDLIKVWENKLIDTYVDRTNLGREEVEELVRNETFMDSDTAIEKGFITGKANTFKAVAKLQAHKIDSKMEENKIPDKNWFEAKFEKLLGKKEVEAKEDITAKLSDSLKQLEELKAVNASLKTDLQARTTETETLRAGLEEIRTQFDAWKKAPLGVAEAPKPQKEEVVEAKQGNPEFAAMDASFYETFKKTISN